MYYTGLPTKDLDCKDDWKLFRYGDFNFKLSLLSCMWSLNRLFNDLAKKEIILQV